MTILANAVASIRVGVEDYSTFSDARMLSAVRNITAGVLLLYKEKLIRLSPAHDPEALVKYKIVPTILNDGTASFIGKGKKTAEAYQIKERFEQFSVAVDWKRFEKIRDLRNDIEHYYTSLSRDNVKEVLAESFVLMRDFLSNELHEDPLQILGANCWQTLLEASDVFEAEKSKCQRSLGLIDWKYPTMTNCVEYFRCENCNSSLIKTEEHCDYRSNLPLSCVSCGNKFEVEDILERAVDNMLGIDAHIAIKDGGESPYDLCHSCSRETYIVAEELCICCESELNYTECLRCTERLSNEEQALDGLCGYCSHVRDKYMDA